jgi:hypothetical protein
MKSTRRRAVALFGALLFLAGVAWVLRGAWAGPSDDASVALRCMAVRCGGEVAACAGDAECRAWLGCMQECGNDKMKCPTFCGAYYQSPKVTAFTECALGKQCISLDFSSLPSCGAPAAALLPLEKADGVWWVAGIKGPDYVLFDDCQRFVLETLGPTEVRARNSVPLTRHAQTRICRNEGKFTRTPSGVMQLVYENYGGYHEDWRFSYRSENTMLAHVCSASKERSVDYGTFVLSRVPLADLGAEEHAALETALRDIYKLELGAVTAMKTSGCANQ